MLGIVEFLHQEQDQTIVHVEETELSGVMMLRPRVHEDARGYFMETYNETEFVRATGVRERFVQDNQSRSCKGVLRGLHYQVGNNAQGKLVRVVAGRIFDVAVDLRRSSATFGGWAGRYLDAHRHAQLWIPAGFAHGFLVLSDLADVAYKTTAPYDPDAERSVHFADPEIAIGWPTGVTPTLSARDAAAGPFSEAELFP